MPSPLPIKETGRPQVLTFDHIQIAIPAGGEVSARRFWSRLLGLPEIEKPHSLAGRGGCWFRLGDRQLHLGVEADFRPARKAHVAFASSDLPDVRARLDTAGYVIRSDHPLDGRVRFFTDDPFGNRLEFIAASPT